MDRQSVHFLDRSCRDLPENLDRAVHIGAVVQFNIGPCGSYRSCNRVKVDRTVHIEAVTGFTVDRTGHIWVFLQIYVSPVIKIKY